jgi:hypothetical protein
MPTPKVKSVYSKQLKAIVDRAHCLRTLMRKDEWPGLYELLGKFSTFAQGYIGLLSACPDEITESRVALKTGIEQLLHEWNILSRACEQRYGAGQEEGPRGFRYNLCEAEKRLQGYCDRWHPLQASEGYLRLHDPVVYFEKLYGISRALCAPDIPVVSIPLTDYNAPDRWQALAHELGHHIYWNALEIKAANKLHADLRDAIAKALKQQKAGRQRMRIWDTWLEEIFADTCGTLLAGADFAESAQNLAWNETDQVSDLGKDDREHPCAYVRPRIAIEVLREIANRSTVAPMKAVLLGDGADSRGIVGRLEERWDQCCRRVEGLKRHQIPMTLQDLKVDIPVVVRAILDTPIWPSEKTLWDLVDWYGQGQADYDARKLKSLRRRIAGDLEPLPVALRDLTKVTLPEIDSSMLSPAVLPLWTYLNDQAQKSIREGKFKRKQKSAVVWSLLLELQMVETRYWLNLPIPYLLHPHNWVKYGHVLPIHPGHLKGHRSGVVPINVLHPPENG